MKRFLLPTLALFMLSFISCSKDQDSSSTATEVNDEKIIPLDQLREEVESTLKSGKIYDWREQSDLHIFSAGEHADKFYTIGYTFDPAFDIVSNMHQIDIKEDRWIAARKAIEKALQHEISTKENARTIQDIMPYGEVEYFPQLIVEIKHIETIEKLRTMDVVRYVEPIGFSLEDLTISQRSDSGCNASPNYSINAADYVTISPSTKRSWNFVDNNITTAWNTSQGDGLRICIIDTGASDSQDNLGSQFASGDSGGRNILKYSTKYSGSWWWKSLDSPHDQCGHGTSMAGFAAAPRGNDGNAVGVAYKADLMTVRAVEDVVISNGNERNGVRDALFLAGNRSDVRIISMSIGSPFSSGTVEDGIYYAYNRDKMIVAAAGTSLTWTSWYGVIFPATMSQTVAVTGLKQGTGYTRCATCHDGSQVDFALPMERNNGNNDRTSLSLANTSNQPKYTGGSSCSTATFAGIAALVWSHNPGNNRSQVLQKIKNASDFYPSRNGNFGWGKVNAAAALTGSNY